MCLSSEQNRQRQRNQKPEKNASLNNKANCNEIVIGLRETINSLQIDVEKLENEKQAMIDYIR